MADEAPTPTHQIIGQLRAASQMADAVAARYGDELGDELGDEVEHFYVCKSCWQPVDKRDLGQVFHHEDVDHAPMHTKDETGLPGPRTMASILARKERPD